jgi:uncharacterized membrane protein YvlD (DUF360 family)
MTEFLIEFGVRFVVFGGVFAVVAWKSERVVVQPKWALPLVGLVFAVLNVALYWAMRPVLDLATLGSMGFLMPLIVNAILLYGTNRVLKPLKIDGILMMLWLSIYLTIAHGVLWLVFEKIL